MPERVAIYVEGAPTAFGHFSQVIKFGNSLHISGQLPIESTTGRLISAEMEPQVRQVFKNLTTILQACAGQASNVMSIRIYLIDLRDHKILDDLSKEVFFFTPPARTVLQVSALPFGARVMIDATAELNPVEMSAKKLF